MSTVPEVLFTYRSAERAKEILSNSCLAFAAPSTFNDLFDCQTEVLHGFSSDAYDGMLAGRMIYDAFIDVGGPYPASYEDNLHRLRNRNRKYPHEDAFGYLKSFIHDEKIRNSKDPNAVLQQEWIEAMDDARICCFSQRNDILLLWSHYASNHSGVVLGFKSALWPGDKSTILLKVQYDSHPPRITSEDEWIDYLSRGVPFNFTNGIRRQVSTKGIDWAYEEEWRYFFMLPRGSGKRAGVSLKSFAQDTLVSVHFGNRISAQDRSDLLSLIRTRYPTADVFDAMRGSGFSLNFVPVE